ncbi:CCD33 protein, partial [Tachuris rubrigastra]|nr:CCD33 protein [Tachuris rubrigastra]
VPMAGKAGEPHIPLTLQRSRLKAEEKTLDFEFEVVSAQFNWRGCYALRLTVENPLLQGSGAGIQLRINGGSAARSSTGTTDTIEQSHLNRIYCFQRRKFTFTLPRGFCKNDKNHDVRLHIEALRFPGRAARLWRGRRVGEAFFAIYPRPDQPRLKLSARRNEDWYRYSAVVALLRVGSEQPAMHCGRLAFTVSLHEHRAPPTPPAPPEHPFSSQEDQQAAGTAPASPDLGISPRSLRTPESAYHSLPAEGHAHFPEVGKPRSGGQRANGSSLPPGTIPISLPQWCWEEGASFWRSPWQLNLVASPQSGWFPVSCAVGSNSCNFSHCVPFKCQITALTRKANGVKKRKLLLFLKGGGGGGGNCAGATDKYRKLVGGEQDAQSREWEMRGREITLLLPAASGRALAGVAGVLEGPYPAGIKSGGGNRRQSGLEHPIAPAGPGYPPPAHLKAEDGHGAAISTTAGTELPPSPPHHLLTSGIPSRPKTTLVLPFGCPTALPHHSSGTLGMWMGGDGTCSGCRSAQTPPRWPCHRIHPSHRPLPLPLQRPAAFLTPSGSDSLPSLDPATLSTLESSEEPQATPLYPLHGQVRTHKGIQRCYTNTLPHGIQPPPSSALGQQEVGSYRLALKRMAGDLLSLRRHVTSLEVENGHLRCSLASQQELGHALLHDTDLDVTRMWRGVHLAATLKHKLVASTAETRRLRDRVQQLQNELIRKNDREKELVLLQRAHRLQQAKLRKCQDKVAKAKGLEETVQQQEKVIKVMERVLQEKLSGAGRSTEKPAGGGAGHVPVSPPPHPSGEVLSGDVHTALLAENRRLREELARAAQPAAPIAPRPPALPGVLGGTEKLSLLARLEEAQARGRVLERQLEKAARKWGREKQELGTRLLEQENGF